MQYEKSCGIIPFRKTKEGIRFLVVKHIEEIGGHVDFPKGHIEAGESEEETAKREAKEEVGIEVKILPGFREQIEYCPEQDVCKTVVFFLGEVLGEALDTRDERIAAYEWLVYEEASDKITYDNSKKLLKKANRFLKKFI